MFTRILLDYIDSAEPQNVKAIAERYFIDCRVPAFITLVQNRLRTWACLHFKSD